MFGLYTEWNWAEECGSGEKEQAKEWGFSLLKSHVGSSDLGEAGKVLGLSAKPVGQAIAGSLNCNNQEMQKSPGGTAD